MEKKNSGLWIAAIAASAVAVGVALFRPKSEEPAPAPLTAKTPSTTLSPSVDPAPPIPPPAPGPTSALAPAPVAGQPMAMKPPTPPVHDPDGPPPPPPPPDLPKSIEQAREIVDRVQFTIRDYRGSMKENPVGNNAEITRALLGDNLKQVRFSVPDGSQLNGQGELCDPWGTPYFFHALARDQMEIRSAGPDRQLWTGDDIYQ